LVTPKPPGWAKDVAMKQDIKIDVWCPDWLEDYYEQQERYWTAEERIKREERKNILKRERFR
jgi:hypothetical protein